VWYLNLRKTCISRHILHQHWYTYLIALPVRRNPQHCKSFDCCLSHFRTWSGIICDFRTSLREFRDPVVNRFTRQTLSTINRKHFFVNILCIIRSWKLRLTAAGIRCADHATPLSEKVGTNFANKRRPLGRYSSLADYKPRSLVLVYPLHWVFLFTQNAQQNASFR
jgi:hypothetical protein